MLDIYFCGHYNCMYLSGGRVHNFSRAIVRSQSHLGYSLQLIRSTNYPRCTSDRVNNPVVAPDATSQNARVFTGFYIQYLPAFLTHLGDIAQGESECFACIRSWVQIPISPLPFFLSLPCASTPRRVNNCECQASVASIP